MELDKFGTLLLHNIAERKFEYLNELFESDVRGRLLLPTALFTTYDAPALINRMKQWFGDSDQFELMDSQVSSVGNWLGVKYRFKAHREGCWFEIEQQIFSEVAGDKIRSFNLVCSGFQQINA